MGGTKTTIQAAPTTPAPSASESAASQFEAQLKYNPQLYEQYAKSYAQYLPQITGTEMAVQQQYAPQLKALQEQMYPQQTQLTEALAGQALQRFQNPFGYTPEEQAALDAIRGRQQEQLVRGLRERANLGGGLYGGRAADTEQRALTEMQQAFAEQDINRRLMAGQQALQYATPVLQMQYPQVSPAQYPQYWQGAVPSADVLYQAMAQAKQPQYYTTGGGRSILGGALGGAMMGARFGPWGALAGAGLGAGASYF
jgi:hypothetical protein